jgi:hypothetical protein
LVKEVKRYREKAKARDQNKEARKWPC